MEAPALIWLQASGPSGIESMLVPMLLMLVPLYFLLIRPEQKRRKATEAMLKAIAKGDRVVTAGGIRGTVVGVTDDVLTLEIGKGGSVKVEVERARIERRLDTKKSEKPAERSDAKGDAR
jgi:preprotein translocase subunit YajC